MVEKDNSDYLPTPFELFGIECCSGWEKLYRPVIEKINEYNRDHPEEPIQIEQIKEKWGTLRIYIDSAPQEIYDLIEKAEQDSQYTCEDCGFRDKVKVKIRNTGGWYRTLCERCFNSYIQKKNEGKV